MPDLSVTVNPEGKRVLDFVLGAALGVAVSFGVMENPLHVQDTVTAALNPPPNLSVQAPDEGCRPRDRVYGATRFVASQNQLEAGNYEAHVKISESLTVLRDIDTGLLQEVPRLAEWGQVDLYGPGAYLKIADTVTASISSGSDLSASGFDELLHVQDTQTAQMSLLLAAGFDEALVVGDGGFVELGISDEYVKLADTVTASINPENTSGFDELLHVQDTATVFVNPEQTSGFDELLHVQDTVTASRSGGG